MLDKLISFLYPARCIFCGGISKDKICGDCEKPEPVSENFAMWLYDGGPRNAVLAFKFSNRMEYGRSLAHFMARDITAKKVHEGIDLIIPVPLHKSRLRIRGYSQTAILAEYLGYRLKIPVDYKSLVRNRNTSPQMNLSKEERVLNLEGSMSLVKSEGIKGKAILLIDDIYTTGSTMKECGRVLEEGGAGLVRYFSVCYQR